MSDTARTAILNRIRASLKVAADDPDRAALAAQRIAGHPQNLVPARASTAGTDLVALFRNYLEGQQATVSAVASHSDVPAAIGNLLNAAGATGVVRRGSDQLLGDMPWAGAKNLVVREGAAEPDDVAGVSYALAGIAETGTLVVGAGKDNPVTLAFLPGIHIIIVARDTIVGTYEEALARVRKIYGASGMPRTLNYISGPSRTADIGGKIVIGAHGPRTLGVIIVG